ncbi:MAG: putative sugar O-methyltransferase [Verrucomicrobia bacterium]|nr:putative sugar O-methyltransferase [Verrucomicrobiota bacterium]
MIGASRIRMADMRPLSPEEHAAALKICAQIQGLVNGRRDYAARHNLAPSIATPGANWAETADNAIHKLYNFVARGEYDVLNRLRLYTQPFTGFQLASMSMVSGESAIPVIPPDFDDCLARLAPVPDHWVFRYHLITGKVPAAIVPAFPKMFGEVGWNLNGRPVNHDVYSYQERMNLMFESGLITWLTRKAQSGEGITMLEIGGGYGGLAYGLLKSIPGRAKYIICDIPESLLFAAIYLQTAVPEARHFIYDGENDFSFDTEAACQVAYVPNYMFDKVAAVELKSDLAINTLSLAEMTEPQIRYYAENVSDMLGQSGLFFEQNHDGRWLGLLDCKPILAQYFPCRKRVRPQTIPVLSKGTVDIWSNRPLTEITGSEVRPFGGFWDRTRLFAWRCGWLVRKPDWMASKLRVILQQLLSPRAFRVVKNAWNRFGGRLSS